MPRPSTRAAGPRLKNLFLLLLGLALFALCVPGPYQPSARAATTFTVNSTGDGPDSNLSDNVCNDGSGNCTLRAAIQQANTTPGAETVNFSVTGTITLASELPFLNTDITLQGPGSGLLTVRRGEGVDYRIFTISSGRTVLLTGLTVSNGKMPSGAAGSFPGRGGDGGGVVNFGTLSMTDVSVTANRAGSGGDGGSAGGAGGMGGGIYNAGTLTMQSCVVSGNYAGDGGEGTSTHSPGGNGGGIVNLGTLTATGSVFSGNTAGRGGGKGGGVYNSGALTMTDCVLDGNSAGVAGGTVSQSSSGGGNGGGIYTEGGPVALSGLKVVNNRAGNGAAFNVGTGGGGGGIFFGVGNATLKNSTISGNSAGQGINLSHGFAGGIFNDGTLTITSSTVAGNTSASYGGGLYNAVSATLKVVNSTVSGNQGVRGGGILNAPYNTLELRNSTITANNSPEGSGVFSYQSNSVCTVGNTIIAGNTGSADAMGSFVSQGHNVVGYATTTDNTPGADFGTAGDQVGTTGAPLDPKLGPLQDNGGPTFTHALLAGSPALDAGSNALAKDFAGSTLQADQRGAGRFAGAGANPAVDVGAVEFNQSAEHVADKATNEDTPVSFAFFTGDQTVSSLTATSDNQTLLPDANISITGSGKTRTFRLTPAADRSGTANVTINLTGSHDGTASQTFAFTVAPINDPPSFTKGADQTVAEDAGPQTVDGWATGISAGPNESSQAVSFQVTGNSNAALFSSAPAVSPTGTLTYTSAPNANGSATVTLVARDDGGTAGGGQDTSAAQTFTINVTPVNDPPVAQNLSVNTFEDSSTSIFFSATDAENNPVTFTVVTNPSHGTLSGSGSSRTYSPALNYNGPDSFTYKATDSPGAESQTATVSITVTAVNDPPVNTVPGPQATDQNTTLVFSAANSNAISVADVDAGTDPLRVTLTATSGTLTLGGTANLTFTAGDGADDATMTFAGSTSDLNAALNGLGFKPTAGFSGSAQLQITTNDQGSTGSGGARTDTDFVSITVRAGTIEFKQSSYTAAEGSGSLAVVVRRTGDTSTTASVAYATDDGSIPSVSVPCSATTGAALDRCDFTKALGRLTFAPGETEKTINVLVGDDSYVEGTETALIRLSGVTGTGVVLGARSVATLEITDDAQESSANPIDDTQRFVRQHYQDFLNREPDADGLAFWTNEIEQCGADQGCREVKRINVSAAFFLSIEFQETGYLVYRLDKVAFGNISSVKPVPLTLSEFLSDTQSIGQGVVVGATGWQQKLEANKSAFVDAFVLRSRFTGRYPTATTPETYVDSLNANAGGVLSQAERDGLVADLKGGSKTRAQALRAVAEHPAVVRRETNRAFVLMQYFGYLRRDPDSAPDADFAGYNFWLGKLNEFNGDYIAAEMVKAFITSIEYRKRFGQ